MYYQTQGEVRVKPSYLCPDEHVVRAISLAIAAQLEGTAHRVCEQPMPADHELTTLALRSILTARNCLDPTGHLCEIGATSGL